MIEFSNISKSFKNTSVLEDISFSVPKGELVVLIGPSGCGKTTTLKMINKLILPSSGKITINGDDLSKKDTIQLRRNIGYVIQQTGLFPHMTVGENIDLIPYLQKWDEKTRHKRTQELLELVGLDPDEYTYRYPDELSGGQQQRIGVARALAVNPDIILMDEPFSALDPITRSSLQDEVFNLQQKLQKTIVFVTHDMDEALKLGDKICIMKDGHIMQFDEPQSILRNPANEFVANFIGKNRLWSNPELISAEDIMIKDPIKTFGERTIVQSVNIMKQNHVDSILVVNKYNVLQGIVTLKHLDLDNVSGKKLKDVMSSDLKYVCLEDSIKDVMRVMKENNISYIPVVDKEKKLKGLITQSSLITTFSKIS